MTKTPSEAVPDFRRRSGLVIRDARQKAGLMQAELAELAGVTGETISRIERGVVTPTVDTLVAISRAVGADEGEMLLAFVGLQEPGRARSRVEGERLPIDVYDGYIKHDIPVIAEGSASPQGELFWDIAEGKPLVEADDWTSRPFDLKDPNAYAVRVRGDSMTPVFHPGMLIIVSPNAPVKTKGDNAYVQLHNGERLIKYVRKQKGGWILESHNRAYDTRFVAGDEVGSMHRVVYAKF
jgi:transcriptional regulator with XRE-family HTH domain